MSLSENHLPIKIAVGISGSGRTLLNLIKQQYPHSAYKIIGVFASSPKCLGIKYANDFSLPLFVDRFPTMPSCYYSVHPPHPIYQWLEEIGAHYVALAGFLRPFPLWKGWENRIVNIHPALLPKFGGRGMYGMNVHRAVLSQKEQVSGATVHYVTENYDEGQIIAQIRVPVFSNDSEETLAERIFKAECDLYPQVLDQISKNINTN